MTTETRRRLVRRRTCVVFMVCQLVFDTYKGCESLPKHGGGHPYHDHNILGGLRLCGKRSMCARLPSYVRRALARSEMGLSGGPSKHAQLR